MKRILGLAVVLVFLASCIVELAPGESYTVTCAVGEVATWDTLSDGSIVVRCNGDGDTQTVVPCWEGTAEANQLDPATVQVDCLTEPGVTLWHGDADNDTDLGNQTLCMDKDARDGGVLDIATDPLGLHGDVYRAHAVSDLQRAEWRKAFVDCDGATEITLWGEDSPPGDEIYIGWRSLFTGDYDLTGGANDGNVVQWKGDSSCGGPAVGMTISNNRLSLRTIDGDPPGVEGLWVDPVLFPDRMDVWTDFVMRVNFAKDSTGWIELWVNGQPQTMSDGTTRHEGPTVCPNDVRVIPKFGVYSLQTGADAFHLTEDPRIGTSYGSVVPR